MVEAIVVVALIAPDMHVFVPEPEVVRWFEAGEYRRPDDRRHQVFHYRLHTPREVGSGRRYPLLLWLHGAHEGGDDNLQQLRWMDLAFEMMPPGEHDYYILAVQCPSDESLWFSSCRKCEAGDAGDDDIEMGTVAMEVLDCLIKELPIDDDRVYVAGVSSGGTACWEIAMRHPDRFAAVAPMASAGADDLARLQLITHVPLWAFHSIHDREVLFEAAKRTVDRLQAIGGSAHLTLVDNVRSGTPVIYEHDCWTGAFEQYDLMRWLLAQRRHSLVAPPPGLRMWVWWNYCAIAAPVAVCWLVWVLEKRRRAMSAN